MPPSKETILDAIRRLAAKNGGGAPGRLALETEAGIRETDWRGVYWAKYSDAVTEAGLAPNEMAKAYPKEHLLSVLCEVTSQLGHIPTYDELKLAKRRNADIPSATVFGRLGSKRDQVRQLLDYSRSNAISAVAEICEATLGSTQTDDLIEPESDETEGFVYLLKSGRRYKIGFTNDLDRRITALSHQTAEPINKIHSIRTDDPSGIEAYWKRRFASKCVHNEWFELTPKDVLAFKRRKKFM